MRRCCTYQQVLRDSRFSGCIEVRYVFGSAAVPTATRAPALSRSAETTVFIANRIHHLLMELRIRLCQRHYRPSEASGFGVTSDRPHMSRHPRSPDRRRRINFEIFAARPRLKFRLPTNMGPPSDSSKGYRANGQAKDRTQRFAGADQGLGRFRGERLRQMQPAHARQHGRLRGRRRRRRAQGLP